MDTLWTTDIEKPNYQSLCGNIHTDALVIGGGMAGILTARKLQASGLDTTLLEAANIGSGVTCGTTAVVSAQHSVLYSDLKSKFGAGLAKEYLAANLQAVRDIANLAEEIDCDFERRPSLMYSKNSPEKLKNEIKTLNSFDFPAYFTNDLPLNISASGGVIFPDMAQFHPLKFLYGAAKGIKIFERSVVRKIKGMTAFTDAGSVTAKHIVVATHFPFIDRRGLYFMKMHQTRESVMVVENAPDLGLTAVENSEKGFFFRNYKKYLLIGCGNHIPGKENEDFSNIALFLKKHIPDAREVCRWVNQDCVTLDGVPYIGRYSPATPDIYVATGFNAWGMTSSMVAAKLLTAQITGQKYEFERVFRPSRPMELPPLISNAARSTVNLLTPTLPRCSHLGCALKYNSSAHTWDCPCHGSRFDENGTVISSPAAKPINPPSRPKI